MLEVARQDLLDEVHTVVHLKARPLVRPGDGSLERLLHEHVVEFAQEGRHFVSLTVSFGFFAAFATLIDTLFFFYLGLSR